MKQVFYKESFAFCIKVARQIFSVTYIFIDERKLLRGRQYFSRIQVVTDINSWKYSDLLYELDSSPN